MEFTRENYEKTISSKCWACTPFNAGWDESIKYGEDLRNNQDLRIIVGLEMSASEIPSWAEEISVSQIGNIPMCGHYLFPRNIEEILAGIKGETTIEFFTSCYTAPPERKDLVTSLVKILEAWLCGNDEKTAINIVEVSQNAMIDNYVIERTYSALGSNTNAKAAQVKRLRNRLKWWIKTFIWEGDNRETFSKDELPKNERHRDADYGNKGFTDPYFAELELEENKNLEKSIRLDNSLDSKIIDQIHSTWLCAPKLFRYLEKILSNGGMHLTPVHATSGVLGLVHAHA